MLYKKREVCTEDIHINNINSSYRNLNTKMHLFLLLLALLHLSPGLEAIEYATPRYNITDNNHTIVNAENITKPGCQSKCGDLTVPYPFGIISEGGLNCSIDPSFDITCDNSTNHPKAFIKKSNLRVYDISNTELRIRNSLTYKCYNESGGVTRQAAWITRLDGTSFVYSNANVLTVVGCDDYAQLYNTETGRLPKGCSTTCENIEEVPSGNECSGSGCCQVSINLQKYYKYFIHSYTNHTNITSFNDCGYTFLGEKSGFKFNSTLDLKDPTFLNRTEDSVRIVLDWVIGDKNCTEAIQDSNSYACINPNTTCIDGYKGYRCSCKEGYKGNPYLFPGCEDINECEQQNGGCEQLCRNSLGSYDCSCRSGYYIDVSDDKRCIVKSQVIKMALGVGFCGLFIIIGINWLYCIMRKRKHSQLREKFFQQNGGLLLKQESLSEGGTTFESTKLFTDEELKKATNNYADDRILGHGGYGVVYKGILPDQRVVAIKKSKVMDKSQVEPFINEVKILTQVNHRNVVKLLGCCLECVVPLLVYEFVSNGTLSENVHNIDGGVSWLSFENRLRIAAESSGALAYLHSAASIPIIHRDVKLANILLDDHHVAKISDFGASRLVPMDQTKVATAGQGTLGYLDPEYFNTGQLTDKSDVYSFGVVLAELLTGRQPICMDNPQEEQNLGKYFITSLKENRLFQIIEPRLVKEGTSDQLQKTAQLVKRCLNHNGQERPTMKEVAMEIESIRKFNNQHGNEETMSLISHTEIQHSDLNEIQLSSYNNIVNDSEQYSSSTISLLHPPTSPH